MAIPNIIFNAELDEYGQKYILNLSPSISKKTKEREELLAILFEQFLLFDKIAVKVDRNSLALRILIEELGINTVEDLINRGTIIPVLWTPLIFTSLGNQEEDGSIDHNTVIGTPPLVSGGLTDEDSDPEKNLEILLANIQLNRDRKRIFTRKARDKYVIPNIEYSKKSVDIVLGEYTQNRFATLGLPAQKAPEDLDYLERGKLRDLGGDVLETTFLSDKKYKSYEKYSYFTITNEAIKNIESAYHVAANTSEIFTVTYQLMEYWPPLVKNPTGNKAMDEFAVIMDNIPKVVFSNTLKNVEWKTARLAKRSLKEEVLALRQESGKDILVGSRSLIIALLNLQLMDELQICIHPVIAGKGLPLFENINDRIELKLVDTKVFNSSGAMVLYYEPNQKIVPAKP